MTFATSEDSAQLGHPPSLIKAFTVLWAAKDLMLLHVDNEDTDQTGRLICVFTGHTVHCVGFVSLQLRLYYAKSHDNLFYYIPRKNTPIKTEKRILYNKHIITVVT